MGATSFNSDMWRHIGVTLVSCWHHLVSRGITWYYIGITLASRWHHVILLKPTSVEYLRYIQDNLAEPSHQQSQVRYAEPPHTNSTCFARTLTISKFPLALDSLGKLPSFSFTQCHFVDCFCTFRSLHPPTSSHLSCRRSIHTVI